MYVESITDYGCKISLSQIVRVECLYHRLYVWNVFITDFVCRMSLSQILYVECFISDFVCRMFFITDFVCKMSITDLCVECHCHRLCM